MKPSRFLRALLASGLLFANIAVVGISGYSLYQSWQQYELRAQTLTQSIGNALDHNISSSIEKIDMALRTVADELERQLAGKGIDENAMNAFLARNERRLPEVEAFRIADADGNLILGKGVDRTEQVSWADRDFFIYHRDHTDRTLQISKPVMGRVSKKYIVAFGQRYNYPDGSFAGVISAPIGLDYFARLLAQFDLGGAGTIVLRDAKDIGLITRFPPIPDQPAGQVGHVAVSPELRRLVESGARLATFHTSIAADGFERIVTFRRLEKVPMIVIAGLASDDYLAGWRSEVYKTSALAFGFLLMSLLAGGILLRLLNQTVRESTRNRIYLRHASDGIQILDATGKLVQANERFCAMLGYDHGELVGMRAAEWLVGWPAEILESEVFPKWLALSVPLSMETQLRRKEGDILDVEVNVSSFDLEGNKYLYASVRDIAERKRAEEQIRTMAYFDSLTDLPNRRLLMDRLGQALIASNRSQEFGALMILDLDNFKALNDTQGHDVGDRLLVEVARRLQASVRQQDTVARLGGDEYVVMVEDLGPDETSAAGQTEMIAEKIRGALSQPCSVLQDGRLHHSTTSIGVTLFRGQELAIDDLFKQADMALYQAKGAGRNAIRFFKPAMQASVESRSAMESALRNGLQQGEFQLFYQPQIDQDGRLTGAEALLRWLPANQAPIPPLSFIPLAEDTGLIIPIGVWVMQTACAQLKVWQEDPHTRDLQIAINVSARQFRQPDFVNQVRTALEESGAPPALLKLELTESVVLEDVEEVIERMQQIKALGVTFSLDDFGTGFSSLSYLKRLPLDQVKIDQSFVRDVTSDPNDAAIVHAIIAMSRSLGMLVIAEGVETAAQLDFLKAAGCMHYQGYLFGKPMPIGEWSLRRTEDSMVASG